MDDENDKRNQRRLPEELMVVLGSSGYDMFSSTFNISPGGMFIRTEEEFPEDSEITLMLATPKDLIYLTGRVKWCQRDQSDYFLRRFNGVGIEIIDPPPEYQHYIEKILKNCKLEKHIEL